MTKVTYSVPAIHCGHCVHTINMEISELEGVNGVIADLDSKTVEIDFNPPASEELLIGTLKEINYPPEIA
ncbi:MAG TPA: heavy-metal-associated domain-containing protein [Pelolinea sp.]|nr:heavy-metal-associated domain-containing protein [Pelolinea sp.]